MRALRILAAIPVALLVSITAGAATPKNVLILRGEAADLPGGTILIDTIETTIRAGAGAPVEFYIESFDTGRFDTEAYDQQFAALLAAKYDAVPIDLVLAFSQPAAQFILRERSALFPRAPLLLGFLDKRLFDEHALPPSASVVYVRADAPGTLRFARQVYPDAHRALVITGVSRFDRGWERVVRDDLAGFDPAFPISYDTQSALETLERRVSALPPDTIVLFVAMTRDGADHPVRPIDALERLRAVSPVPIFGLSGTHLGHGLVGGSLIDFLRHGAELGRQAVRMLAGEVPPPIVTPSIVAADWRELQRFNVPTAAVPPGTSIEFREPTLWDEYKGTILVALAVLIAQFALILLLVRASSRRRESERELLARLRFEQQLSEIAMTLASSRPAEVPRAVESAVAGLAEDFGFVRAWRWRNDEFEDAAWKCPPLAAGEAASFTLASQLPPSIQRRLKYAGMPACAALAVPISANDVCLGAMFWIAPASGDWKHRIDQLRVVGAVIATVLQRKQVEVALEDSNQLRGAIVDSLPAQIAVLDRGGVIIAVNETWTRFGRQNAGALHTATPYENYLQICREGARAGAHGADQAANVIELACRGERTDRQVEYASEAPDGLRWFTMRAEPLLRPEGGAVVAHWDITDRKRNEIALRESEDRFRRMADALPMAIWMADENGGCTYFNRGWLDLTGRTLEQEKGDGWLEGVHLADRSNCVDAYLRAFHMRHSFSIEYRIRRHDGQYRWFIDSGVPRYGDDGSFLGYIGGCLDISERKEAEHALRELTHRLMSAQDDERRRIARELHDHLSQQLALLAIDLQQLSARPPASPDAFVPMLHEAWRRTTEIASDVHAISHRLHPSKMEALGLPATIRAHCREVSRQSLVVDFLAQEVPPIAPERALSLFRVVEEALSNVVRHSGARSAQVALAGGGDGGVLLRIADDGRGFAESRRSGAGLGLISMRERIQSLDGTLSISSVPGRGTVVEVRVPAVAHPLTEGVPQDVGRRAESA
jgi:PAS domain S-box-containing protein